MGPSPPPPPPLPPLPNPPPPPPPKPQRTIQVKIGSQAAKSMTPDQAAEYLKSIAGRGGFGGAREVKMTFNNNNASTSTARGSSGKTSGTSSLNIHMNSSPSAAAASFASAAAAASASNSSVGTKSKRKPHHKEGMPCSEKEMKALMSMFVEIMGLQMNTDKLNASPYNSNNNKKVGGAGNSNNTSTTTTETDETDSLPDLEDAWSPLIPTASASTTTATTNANAMSTAAAAAAVVAASTGPGFTMEPVTGKAGIPAFEWETLERVAIEDALEQEERARKSSHRQHKQQQQQDGGGGNNKTNKNPSSSSLLNSIPSSFYNTTAAAMMNASTIHATGGAGGASTSKTTNATAAASSASSLQNSAIKAAAAIEQRKQHLKVLAAWKSQVVAAVQSGSCDKLQQCLQESPVFGTSTTTSTSSNKLPYNKNVREADDMAVLEQLLPYCGTLSGAAAKKKHWSPQHAKARELLTEFIAKSCPRLLIDVEGPTGKGAQANYARHGRSVVHAACFDADVPLLSNCLLPALLDPQPENNSNKDTKDDKLTKSNTNQTSSANLLNTATCSDSGWTPLQYACLSGSLVCMELLLDRTCSSCHCDGNGGVELFGLSVLTNPTHTWLRNNDQVGLSALQLLECVLATFAHNRANSSNSNNRKNSNSTASNKNSSSGNNAMAMIMETHGMGLEEVHKKMANSKEYVATLERVLVRLRDIESNGYTKRSPEEIAKEEAAIKTSVLQQQQDDHSNNKNKKKSSKDTIKVEGDQSSGSFVEVETGVPAEEDDDDDDGDDNEEEDFKKPVDSAAFAPSAAKKPLQLQQDPLVTALLGMGFAEEQIMNGIRACGGVDRATADDVVAWIFGGQETGNSNSTTTTNEASNQSSNPPHLCVVAESVGSTSSSTTSVGTERRKSSSAGSASATSGASTANAKVKAKARNNNNNNKNQSEAKRQEAFKKAEAERVASELQAAKREEQRRRNREWNNRAQVRQQQEAQAMITKAAGSDSSKPRMPAARPPPPNAGGLTSAPVASYFPQPPPGPVLAASSSGAPRLKSAPFVSSTSSPKSGEVPHAVNQLNDASTIASSIDVDFGNDDATVSTLGSFLTSATPVPGPIGSQPPKFTQQIVPPGFNQPFQQQLYSGTGGGGGGGGGGGMGFSEQLLARPTADSRTSGRALSFGPSSSSMIPPPGIPETQPYVVDSNGLPSSSFSSSTYNVGLGVGHFNHHNHQQQPRLATAQDALAGASNGLLNTGLLGGPLTQSPHPTSASTTGVSPLFSAHQEPSSSQLPSLPMPPCYGGRVQSSPAFMSVGPPSRGTSAPAIPQLPGPIGFGLDAHRGQHHQQHQHLDSSIIDSISTGNTVLPGASLWGDAQNHYNLGGGTNKSGGSSLLGSLIQSDLCGDNSTGEPSPVSNHFLMMGSGNSHQQQQQQQQLQQQQQQQQQQAAHQQQQPNGHAPQWGNHHGSFQRTGSGSIW